MLNKKEALLILQKNEITESNVYKKLASISKNISNKKILNKISNDELRHYNFWKKYTHQDVKLDSFRLFVYLLIARIFGITFSLKLMEKGEGKAQLAYKKIEKSIPDVKNIIKDEHNHENQLLSLIDEDRLKYIGSMVLGLNDALVELTGALAGLTLAFQNSGIIVVAGLITGVAASISMAASEYQSTKTEGTKNPIKSSFYTGLAYFVTVLFLILPYLIFKNLYLSLGFTILNAIIVILIFTFYIAVIKDVSYKRRFFEMAFISLGVAALTFGISYLIKVFLGVQI